MFITHNRQFITIIGKVFTANKNKIKFFPIKVGVKWQRVYLATM